MTISGLSLRLASVVSLSLLGGCTTSAPPDDSARAKMADELVQCKNERLSLKEKIADLTAELEKLKAAAADAAAAAAPAAQPDTPKATEATTANRKAEVAHRSVAGGEISQEALVQVVKKNSTNLRACYERGMKRRPELQYVSSVEARITVENSGIASGVTFSPRTDSEMEKCMRKAIATWPFPSFKGDAVQVQVPVSLVAK
jgi:hypothetical protein